MHERAGRVVAQAGDRVTLPCVAQGHPPPHYTWYRGTEPVTGSTGMWTVGGSLVLGRVGVVDAAQYTCVANNTAGETRVSTHLLVTLPLSVQCAATYAHDYAHAHAYVTLGGQYVSAHGDVISHVNISSVHVTDGGTYTCSAENSAGSEVHRARLNVYGPPHVRPMGQMSAVAGETFIVSCPVSGYPIHNITWKKDGVRLPTSHRQRVHANGTLVVEQVTRTTDDGLYSCTASTRQGLTDTQDLSVRVMGESWGGGVLESEGLGREGHPSSVCLWPFHFEDKLEAGERAGAACIVSKGDPPITFTWEKDGRPIEEVEGVTVSTINQFSNTLMINRLTALHTGQYTCRASNHWAEATHSADLAVNVPPTWVVEPTSASVALGGSVALHCLAKGFPNPTVAWRKETEPPWFAVRSQRQQVKVGGTATLSCEAHGDAPLALSWTRGTAPLPPLPRYVPLTFPWTRGAAPCPTFNQSHA
ncbi:Down syndrome cell adhesion molecule-like protein 2-like 13, partial [Homarus americanus]